MPSESPTCLRETLRELNNLKYYFKARYKQTESTEAQFKELIIDNFQKLFMDNNYKIFDTIWNNQGLRSSLFPNNNQTEDEDDAKIEFENLVDTFNNNLYKFIQIK